MDPIELGVVAVLLLAKLNDARPGTPSLLRSLLANAVDLHGVLDVRRLDCFVQCRRGASNPPNELRLLKGAQLPGQTVRERQPCLRAPRDGPHLGDFSLAATTRLVEDRALVRTQAPYKGVVL